MPKQSEPSEVSFWMLAYVCPVANAAALATMRGHYPPPGIMSLAAAFSVVTLIANLVMPRRLPRETRQATLAWSTTATVLVTLSNLLCGFSVLLPME